ncbi:MAG: protein-glutamate O-methyltransferase CheR [Bacteroidota bacterium]|nr:protein-glutamate O-methyltransferase CheR [Bacteroidota bacterium]
MSEKISTRVEINDEELSSLTNAIKTRYGIDFTCYEAKSLKRGFARLIARHELGSLLGLWSKILKDREFLISYIDELLVNLTELFRNPEVWVKINTDILEKLKDKTILKFWHAGCSTGEEIYSMAIILKELKLLSKTRAVATDLSTTALELAREGKYNEMLWKKYTASFLNCFPRGNLQNYFSLNQNNFVIKEEMQKHIRFLRHNLAQDKMDQKFDMVLCRNVMIYFDDTLKMKALRLFYDSLEDDGYLIIGYYDMLPEQSKTLFKLYDATTRIYKKNL